MIKVLFLSSEKKDSFGVNQVIFNLTKNLKKKCKIDKDISLYKYIFSKYDLIHIHGCWKTSILFYTIIAKFKKIKIIFSPHGMLDPGSFRYKKIFKIIFWQLFQKNILKFADLVITNSNLEKKNINKILKNKKIKVLPHGIDLPGIKKKINFNRNLRFVYFSRIHPIKNLHTLSNIWIQNDFFKKYNLDIYGPIANNNYFNSIKKKIKKNQNINYCGQIYKNKLRKLSEYDVLIHPSHSENFGLVIIEALSVGLYIILNKNLPWQELQKKNFASLINFNPKNLISTIKIIEKNKSKLFKKKEFKKKQNYLFNNFEWNKICKYYLFFYKNI